MTNRKFLAVHGWRLIGSRFNGLIETYYWDHPQHQPDERGAFTTNTAVNHQRMVLKNCGCDCIKEDKGGE